MASELIFNFLIQFLFSDTTKIDFKVNFPFFHKIENGMDEMGTDHASITGYSSTLYIGMAWIGFSPRYSDL